jgi:uncharacterized iron-regulated membrane protein
MRRGLVLLHRWFGLFIASFLVISGLTGAVISWDHELDAWLNPALYRAQSGSDSVGRSSLELASELESREPGLIVTYLPLALEPGEALLMSVDPHPDAGVTGAVVPTFNQVALDPADGAVQGERWWGAASLTRENLLPFLYKLHYSMHIPDYRTVEVGVWFMGVVAIVWLLDCFVALAVSFPNLSQWRKSFRFRVGQGGVRLLFDTHRSGGVWLWILVGVIAFTSISMNLQTEVVRPLVNQVSTLTPGPFDNRPAGPAVAPLITREDILERSRIDAKSYDIETPPGGILYSPEFGVYGVGFFAPGHEHGDGSLGNPYLYYDGATGAPAGADLPGRGTAGDTFMQLQFPLHSGRIVGVPGRILVSLLGLTVATLSITGVCLWSRRRAAARKSARSQGDYVGAGFPGGASIESGT